MDSEALRQCNEAGASTPNRCTPQLLENCESSLNYGGCHLMTKEMDELKSTAVQSMVDVYHQSGAKSWSQWVNNSPLNNIRQNHPEIFGKLQNYQLQFTENIYAPLSEYLLSSHNVFKGAANHLIQQIFSIYNHLTQRKIRPNCCMQVDVRCPHDIISRNHDDEHVYEQYNGRNEMEHEFKSNSNKVFNGLSEEMICQILSKCVMPDADIYKRYEVIIHADNIKSFEAVSNNTVCECFKNLPLCMIFNSTASAKQILNEFCPETAELITVSFHLYHGTILVYLYVSDDKGQLFGSRIFADDLTSMIPLLFEDSTVDPVITNQLNNYLHFKPNAVYKQYYLSLIQHAINHNDAEQKSSADHAYEAELDPLLVLKLEETVNSWNSAINKQHIKYKVKQCFIEHEINVYYFQCHTRKDFIQLLRKYKIKISTAAKLWQSLAVETDANETKTNVSAVTEQEYLQKQNQTYFEKIQLLESELRAKNEENHYLKRIIETAMSDEDPSGDMKQSNGAEVTHLASSLAHNGYISNENDNSSHEWRCYYYQELRYTQQFYMSTEVSFVLYVLYLCIVYQKFNGFWK